MKFLVITTVLVAIVIAIVAIVRARRKSAKPSTQARIVAHVQDHLTERQLRTPVSRSAPVVEYPNSKPTVKSYEMKSRKNRKHDGDADRDVDFGYWETDGGPSYTETGSHVENSGTYLPAPETTRYEAPSSSHEPPTSYSSNDSGSSSSYDSGSSSSSSSSDY